MKDQSLKQAVKKQEDLYVRILLWAYGKQETGFTLDELRNNFALNSQQELWTKKIFLTFDNSDRKFFEYFRNDNLVTPNINYYALNEKGIMAAINYKGLEHAEKNSEQALWFAGISILLTAFGLFFTIKQTNLTEVQSAQDQLRQTLNIKSALTLCKNNPGMPDSGLYGVSSGKSLSCAQVIHDYSEKHSFWDTIRQTILRIFNK